MRKFAVVCAFVALLASVVSNTEIATWLPPDPVQRAYVVKVLPSEPGVFLFWVIVYGLTGCGQRLRRDFLDKAKVKRVVAAYIRFYNQQRLQRK